MPQALLVTWPLTNGGSAEKDVTSRAELLLGQGSTPIEVYFEPFNVAHRQIFGTDNVNGSAVADSVTGGLIECRTGAVAASRGSVVISSGSTGYLAPFAGGTAASFYLYTRMKLTTAFDAQTVARICPAGGGAGFELGFIGSVSAANWSCTFTTGGSLISTVPAVNGTFVELEVCRVGGLTSFYVNRTLAASGDLFPTAAAAGLALWCSNGTTAADRRAAFDTVAIATPRLP